MKPDLSLPPAPRALEQAHALLRELYLAPDGRIWILRAAGAPHAEWLEVALAQLQGDLLPLLAPWRCAYCGGTSELPDSCTRCHAALKHHARDGAGFVLGSTVLHAVDLPATAEKTAMETAVETACGLTLEGGPCAIPSAPRQHVALVDLPPATLCRRCLPVLHRRHAAYLATLARMAATRPGRRRG